MPAPLFLATAAVAGAALTGLAFLLFGDEDEGGTDSGGGSSDENNKFDGTGGGADDKPDTGNGGGGFVPTFKPNPGTGGGQAVTWDTALYGGGSQPMNWVVIRTQLALYGWPIEGGLAATDEDVNGPSCPEPGKGSRAGCPASQQLKNYQAGFNRLVDMANAGTIGGAPGSGSIFAGQPKLVVDGILGANTLKSMKTALAWQELNGGPFGVGRMREVSIA